MNEFKILIVDDNRDLADCMAILLEQEGYTPTVVYTGEDAVARALVETYDLAVIDIKLPGMNGVEVFHAIRELRPGISGIMITAYQLDSLSSDVINQGTVCVLRKPFPMDALLTKISDLQQENSSLLPTLQQRSIA